MQDEEDNMAIPFETPGTKRDARAVKILAKTIYKELRTSGLDEKEVMSLAGELLGLVSSEVRSRQPVLASARRRPAGQACPCRRAPRGARGANRAFGFPDAGVRGARKAPEAFEHPNGRVGMPAHTRGLSEEAGVVFAVRVCAVARLRAVGLVLLVDRAVG